MPPKVVYLNPGYEGKGGTEHSGVVKDLHICRHDLWTGEVVW